MNVVHPAFCDYSVKQKIESINIRYLYQIRKLSNLDHYCLSSLSKNERNCT